ncbi:MAG: M15 family metallopeptidase [Clostridia bacterium]|nr:M15 family metallopeptidase [Clostridia bacterium]
MNSVEIREPERKNPERRNLSPEERARIAQRRRKRKRTRKIRNAVIFSLCTLIIILCGVTVAYVLNGIIPTHKTPVNTEKLPENIYSSFPYYKEEYENRYTSYAAQNPQLSDEDVVWMVNANQDKPKYNYDIPVSGYDDICIIVNKYYKVPDGYSPPDLVNVDGQKMRKEAADAFVKMRNDASRENLRIRAVSGYRTVSYQRGLYNRYLSSDSQENVDRYSARPGYSEHHTGLAVDVFGSVDGLRQFENTPEFPWVRDNCYKYGFIIRYFEETEDITGYESEPWHLRYVGARVSTDMKEKGINSFEEYHAKYLQ